MNTVPTPEQFAAIEASEAAATPGPWEKAPNHGDTFYANLRGEYMQGVGDLSFGSGDEAEADLAFVLGAREDVPALLAEVKRLQARVAELERCAPGESTLMKCWIDDHGAPCEWSEEIRRAYANTLANCRAAGAL